MDLPRHWLSIRSVEPVAKPATRFWDQLSSAPAPGFEPIMAAARQFADHLHWRTNNNYIGIFDDHFFENETFTEIIGPTGLLIADNFRAGFLILGENVHYPDHSHAATELYHPVSGTGVWMQGDGEKRKNHRVRRFSHPMGKSRHVGDDTCAGAMVMGG